MFARLLAAHAALSRPLRLLAPLSLAALAVGCGPPRYLRVETGAEEIRQGAPGQSLLAAAPPAGHDLRVVFGGGTTLGQLAEGRHDAAVTLAPGHLGGELAVNVGGEAELSVVARGGIGQAVSPTALDAQWGLRLRLAPGNERFRIGLSAELGGRHVSVRQGESLICDVDQGELPGEWVPAVDGTCYRSDYRRGRGDETVVPYFAATVYPTVRVGEHAWVFVGLGIDTVVEHYRDERVIEAYDQSQIAFTREEYTEYDRRWAPTAVAGLDLRLQEHLGLLVNGRVAGLFDGEPGAMAFTLEGGLQAQF